MKAQIVISTDDNPQYRFYVPLCVWAWNQFGWDVIILHRGHKELYLPEGLSYTLHKIPAIDPYQSDTIAQVSRLYAAIVAEPGYLMTGDVDMIPLSNYWQPDPDQITVWGHDLTGFGHYPICYIGMETSKWKEVMRLDGLSIVEAITRDLEELPQASGSDPVRKWVTDQDLITSVLKPHKKDMVNRGILPNGYAYGRVDRSAWTLDHPEFIDSHLMRDIYSNPDNLAKTLLLLYKIWPNENFDWFVKYAQNFA